MKTFTLTLATTLFLATAFGISLEETETVQLSTDKEISTKEDMASNFKVNTHVRKKSKVPTHG